MQSTLVLVVKIGLLVVLWLFIWVAVRAMNRDVGRAATAGAVPVGGGCAAGGRPVTRRRARRTARCRPGGPIAPRASILGA